MLKRITIKRAVELLLNEETAGRVYFKDSTSYKQMMWQQYIFDVTQEKNIYNKQLYEEVDEMETGVIDASKLKMGDLRGEDEVEC